MKKQSKTRKEIFLFFCLFLVGLLISLNQANAQRIVYVDHTATGSNNGTSWEDAYVDLQGALGNAQSLDTIWVAQGTYKPAAGYDRTISFQIPDSVVVYGGFDGTESNLTDRDYVNNPTILSGDIGTQDDSTDNSYNVVYFNSVSNQTGIDGFLIKEGKTGDYVMESAFSDTIAGGGILNAVYEDGKTSNPVIRNCTFTDNYGFMGGGMCNYADNGSTNPTIVNCTFTNNTAFMGGGLSNFAFNSGLCEPSIDTCTFSYNMVSNSGGGMGNIGIGGGSNPDINYCTFLNNVADTTSGNSEGGGIANNSIRSFDGSQGGYSNTTYNNCTFTGNISSSGGGMSTYIGYSCTGINNINNCTFDKNKAMNDGDGGGLNISSDTSGYAVIVITGSTFSNDTAYSAAGDWSSGGGMYIYCNSLASIVADLENCSFQDNFAKNRGGGLTVETDSAGSTQLTLEDCGFTSNKAFESEGGGIAASCQKNGINDITIINTSFNSNQANGNGGGFYNTCDNAEISPEITGSLFIANQSGNSGGGIYNACWGKSNGEDGENTPILTNNNFYYNKSTNQGGGGMYNYFSDAELNNTNFYDNRAETSGGAISNNQSNVIIDDCLFDGNEAKTENGGAISSWKYSPVIKNSTFSNNTCFGAGGGIFNNSSDTKISQCIIKNNHAGINGGGIANYAIDQANNSSVKNSKIFNNTAWNYGGGAYNVADNIDCNPLFANCVFYGDSASKGGAIATLSMYASGVCNTQIINCSMSGNYAYSRGGALANDEPSGNNNTSIVNSIIWGNSKKGGQVSSSAYTTFHYSNMEGSGGSTNWNSAFGTDIGNNIDSNPFFVSMPDTANVPDASGNLDILETSPCLDAGKPDTSGLGLPSTDIQLNPRVINGTIDMGAYEVDTISPTLTLTNPTVYLNHTGSASIQPFEIIDAAYDNASLIDTTISQTDFTCSDLGVVTVEVSITDYSENITTKTADVTVMDTLKPSIACAEDMTVNADESNSYTMTGTEGDPASSSDNCSIKSVVNDYNNESTLDGASFPAGTTTVTWTVTDTSDNTSSCSFDITVNEYVGINDFAQKGISVYPNPTKGQINLEFDKPNEIKQVQITELTGKTILKIADIQRRMTLSLPANKSGIFIIHVQTDNEIIKSRIIKY